METAFTLTLTFAFEVLLFLTGLHVSFLMYHHCSGLTLDMESSNAPVWLGPAMIIPPVVLAIGWIILIVENIPR